MDKAKIIEVCRSLSISQCKYCVGFGAALVLYGIKVSTNDVDIEVIPEVFEAFSGNYPIKYCSDGEAYISIDDVVDMFKCSNLPSKPVIINGIPVFPLQNILEKKKRLGRTKDIKDIEMIESFLQGKL
ncbi:MAG: hypothetical protein ACM3TR_06305 [Caulobacteraceae bacterium]